MPPPLPAKGVECPGDYGVHVATAPSDPPSHPQKLGIRVATVPRHGSSVPEVMMLPQGYPWWPRSGSSVSKVFLLSQCWLQCHRGAAVPKANQISRGWILSGVSVLSWQQPQCPGDGWGVPGWL